MGSNRLDLYEVAREAFYKSQPQWKCSADEDAKNRINQHMALMISALIDEQEGRIGEKVPVADLAPEQRALDKLLGFADSEQAAPISKAMQDLTNEMRTAIVMGRVMQQTQVSTIAH